MKQCHSCGKTLNPNMQFCDGCGADVRTSDYQQPHHSTTEHHAYHAQQHEYVSPPHQNAAHASQEPQGQGFAIASLVLGILALVLPIPILDLILGILAIVFVIMSRSRGGQGGLWVTALVFSIIGIVSAFFFTIFWLFLGAVLMEIPWSDIFNYY
ncbi:MAG: hypothetical protein FWC75_02670 [Oscillospiraceae bacterium]|nr:hypothetical protein [Oscillospiraceae bacterium]